MLEKPGPGVYALARRRRRIKINADIAMAAIARTVTTTAMATIAPVERPVDGAGDWVGLWVGEVVVADVVVVEEVMVWVSDACQTSCISGAYSLAWSTVRVLSRTVAVVAVTGPLAEVLAPDVGMIVNKGPSCDPVQLAPFTVAAVLVRTHVCTDPTVHP